VIRYLIRRLLWAIILFVAVTIVTYVIFFLIPADPAARACGQQLTPQCVKQARHYLGLDKPIYIQYTKFMGRLLPFDFHALAHADVPFKTPSLGISFANRQKVNSIVGNAAPVTASLVFGGAITWLLISLPIGILSALRPRSTLDRSAMIFVLIGISAHPVWIGLIFLYLFAFRLHAFPLGEYCNMINPPVGSQCGGPVQWFYHLILPWITFAILFAALYVRMIRANVIETLSEDYVRTARAKGAPESRVLRSHVLRNAMLPVVTMLGMDIAIGLGGAIFTENVYDLPGLGRVLLNSISNFDLPTTQGIVVFGTIAIIAFNLIVDLLYAAIDPRIRLS
jgi:peptide/nickel transport system permease protein